MKILRIIKLKEITGEIDSLSDNEKIFIKYFDNLTEKRLENNIVFLSGTSKPYFRFDMSSNIFWCSYENVAKHFRLEKKDMKVIIKNILEDYLKIKGENPIKPNIWTIRFIIPDMFPDKYFENGYY